MRIKSLAHGENILMLGFELSTSLSKIDILTTRPIYSILICSICRYWYSQGLNQTFNSLLSVFPVCMFRTTFFFLNKIRNNKQKNQLYLPNPNRFVRIMSMPLLFFLALVKTGITLPLIQLMHHPLTSLPGS